MFDCDCCGLCCRQVRKYPDFAKEYDRGDGVCKHLMNDNRCAIYETRPDICNVDLMYERYFFKIKTREEFYKINKKQCESFKSSV